MRFLVLANNALGLYNFRKKLLKELIDCGNEVYISLPFGEKIPLLEEFGCKFIDTHVDRRGINPLKDIKLIKAYLAIFKKIKPDMVITYTIKPNIYGSIVSRLNKIPYCVNITGLGTAFQNENWLKKFVTLLYKFALKKVKIVFFENSGNSEIFINNKIIPKSKVCLLNGAGVDLDEYTFKEYPEADKLRFLFIGRVMKEKGIDELFEAIEKIKTEYDVEFDIVGPLEDDYKTITDDLNSRGIINYYGPVDDVKPFIEGAHCFVLPSYHEGMANTLLESGAMGRPIITTAVHGCLEAVIDTKTGYLCNVKDALDLYEKLKKFIELPYEEKKNMGRLSYEHISFQFDKKKVVEMTIKEIVS